MTDLELFLDMLTRAGLTPESVEDVTKGKRDASGSAADRDEVEVRMPEAPMFSSNTQRGWSGFYPALYFAKDTGRLIATGAWE